MVKQQKNIVPVILDVTKEAEIKSAVGQISDRLTKDGLKLVGLVNNAGYNEYSVLELVSLDRLRKQFEVNVFGHVAVTQAVLPLLRSHGNQKHGPRVVNITSVLGLMSLPGFGPYAATKHAMEAIGDSLRMELQSWGIHVVTIQPGSIKTNFDVVTKETHAENVLGEPAASSQSSEAVVKAYQNFTTSTLENQAVIQKLAATTSVTNEAIEASLLDARPQFRYKAGFDSKYLLPFFVLPLPHIIRDRVFARFFRKLKN